MGRVLAGWGWLPDVVLTSSAVRARDTVELAGQAGQWPCPVEVVDWLYGAEPADVVSRLVERDRLPPRVLIAGHEPTLSELVSLLISGGRVRMPTAAVACLELEGEWRELAPGRGRLLWLITPKLVQSAVQ
jgi:phosphohistidine phosphatase